MLTSRPSKITFILVVVALGIAGYLIFGRTSTAVACENGNQASTSNSDFAESTAHGAWAGTMSQNGRSTAIRLDIAFDGTCMGVRVSMPEAALFYLPAQDLEISGNTLSFTVPGAPYKVQAKAPNRDGEMSGKWKHRKVSVKAPFTLKRISNDPVRLTTRDITFRSSDGAELVGTLILPNGDGPYPAIVWTHGSGPDTRTTAYYASRGYLAASLGMAAFIYDKRGFGESKGSGFWDIRNMFKDGLAAVKTVEAQPEILNNRVGIGGYSQGGWVSPYVAAHDPSVAFVAVGSAPGITPAEQNVYTVYSEAREYFDDDTAKAAAKGLQMVYDYYQTGKGYDEVLAYLNREENRKWSDLPDFRAYFFSGNTVPEDVDPKDWGMLFYDPLPDWHKITVPVIAFWGAEDKEVPPVKSRDLIGEALMEAGNNSVDFFIFPDAGHGLMQETDVPEGEYDWNRAAPGYVEALTKWIKARVSEANTNQARAGRLAHIRTPSITRPAIRM